MDSERLFRSRFIIDGVPEALTPEALLAVVAEHPAEISAPVASLMDESVEPDFDPVNLAETDVYQLLERLKRLKRSLSLQHPGSWTKCRLAEALMAPLWRKGHFRLGDLCVRAQWQVNLSRTGSAAAFYKSVAALADYLDRLGVKLSAYGATVSRGRDTLTLKTRLSGDSLDEDSALVLPYRTAGARLATARACSPVILPDARDWLVYIPFETADFRLGGSLLAQALGTGGPCPQLEDPDYFMDSYELVRELVEDGVAVAGVTVCDGGLLPTLERMAEGGCGAQIDLSELMGYYQENCLARILFAEVPGAILQLRDTDFDYLDAEMLLQDIVYFPLGHPVPGTKKIRLGAAGKSGIQNILDALLRERSAEGED